MAEALKRRNPGNSKRPEAEVTGQPQAFVAELSLGENRPKEQNCRGSYGMNQDVDIFLSIAQIAGISIGFGALISFSRYQEDETQTSIRAVLTLGLA